MQTVNAGQGSQQHGSQQHGRSRIAADVADLGVAPVGGWRFVHAADLHLDTPFEGVEVHDRDLAERLRDASLDAWDALVDATLACGASLLLLAGDLYDGAHRGVRAQLRLRSGLQRLSDADVHVAIVHGNHDPLDGWSAIERWPELVTVFGSDRVGEVPIHVGGRRVATVHGTSYATRDVTDNLASRFRRGSGAGIHIGLLHANIGDHADHAAYAPASLDDLRAVGMDYWALGHVHVRQTLAQTPWVVYPGNTQGRSVHRGERGAKGAVVVDVSVDGHIGAPSFIELGQVRFERTDLVIAESDGLADLHERLVAAALAERRRAAGRPVVLQAVLTGRGVVHALLAQDRSRAELLEALRDETTGVWWLPLEVRTRPLVHREALRGRDDVVAALVERVDTARRDPSELGERFAELVRTATRFGVDLGDPRDLLEAAEVAAIDALEPADA